MSADVPEPPPPKWAVEMARRHFRMTARELAMADKDHDAYRFARALRDAYCRGWRACYDSVTTALSLLHTPPSGGA